MKIIEKKMEKYSKNGGHLQRMSIWTRSLTVLPRIFVAEQWYIPDDRRCDGDIINVRFVFVMMMPILHCRKEEKNQQWKKCFSFYYFCPEKEIWINFIKDIWYDSLHKKPV